MKRLALILSAIGFIAASTLSAQTHEPDSTGYIVRVGDVAPDFEVTLDNGSTFRLSDQRGKLVMLQFTASWCGVCRQEMPFIERDIWQRLKDRGDFVLVGIDRDEPLAKLQSFSKQTGITYPLALDPGADVFGKYALKKAGVTRNVLIDKDGRIIKLTRLYDEAEFASLVSAIDNALGIKSQHYKVETFKTAAGNNVDITLIKHGSLAISYKGLSIEIDPVAGYGNYTDYKLFPKADVIMVTHEHGDHFNPETIDTLSQASTRLYLNQRCYDQLHRGTVLHNGESFQLADGIQVDVVPAYNTTEGHLQYHPKGVGNGFVFTFDGSLRVYVAGDTEDIPEMANLHDIDVCFLPVNQPYTMTVGQAVHAAQVIKPRILIPYHFSQTDVSQIKQQLDAANSGVEVWLRDMQ